MCLGGVPGSSGGIPERSETSRERPRGVLGGPGVSPEWPGSVPKAARIAQERPKGSQSDNFVDFQSILDRFWVVFWSLFGPISGVVPFWPLYSGVSFWLIHQMKNKALDRFSWFTHHCSVRWSALKRFLRSVVAIVVLATTVQDLF